MHLTEARKVIESGEEVSLAFWTKSGEIVHAPRVVCTSSHFHGNTFNLKWKDSDQFRKVKAVTIHNVNGEEIYL